LDPLLAEFARALLPEGARVVTPTRAVAAALTGRRVDAQVSDLAALPSGRAGVLALLADELSHAGEGAEGLVAETARVLRPGGLLLVSAVGAVWAEQQAGRAGGPGRGRAPRTFTAEALAATLGHAGYTIEGRYAPGAATRLTGATPRFEASADRLPGLLDAAERVVAVARRYASAHERSRSFFASLPRKVVAAAVICRDARGDLLVVHDTFKQGWTIPGGVVDADEDPRAAATREAYEETGLRVTVGDLLGVFSAMRPDRLVFVFAGGADPGEPSPVHGHEIDQVAWVPVPDALRVLAPHVAEQVRRCLSTPGGVWPEA
jgi:8-oxo-dGTP pyrophosphatase MutT (NUDIX family)